MIRNYMQRDPKMWEKASTTNLKVLLILKGKLHMSLASIPPQARAKWDFTRLIRYRLTWGPQTCFKLGCGTGGVWSTTSHNFAFLSVISTVGQFEIGTEHNAIRQEKGHFHFAKQIQKISFLQFEVKMKAYTLPYFTDHKAQLKSFFFLIN